MQAVLGIGSALQQPKLGSASAVAAQLAAQGRSSWRISMSLLLEAWALQMHLVHGIGNDVKLLEGVMDRLGVSYKQRESNAAEAGAGSSEAGLHAEPGHKRHTAKHGKTHRKHANKKHKRERSDSPDSDELLPRDYTDMREPAAGAEWELDGVLGASDRVTCRYPELADILVAHKLTCWSREIETR